MIPAFSYWLDNMGDHTVASWVCAGAHLVAGMCSWREAVRSNARSPERTLWASVGALLLAIGLNKQLDLQILATKELGALFGHSAIWGSRRLIAAVVFTALGVAVVRAFVAFARAVHVRAWPLEAAAGAAAALAALVMARGTTGVVNEALVMDLHGSVGDVLQVQVKDVLELFAASVIVVSCLGWRVIETEAPNQRHIEPAVKFEDCGSQKS